MNHRLIDRATLLAVVGVTSAMFVAPRVLFFARTGRLFPIRMVDHLSAPVAVSAWNPQELALADGRSVPLPGIQALPADSVALREATQRGVEIDAVGRVWGLVKVHHGCGNDPVREHTARVNLADMMLYLRVGEPGTPTIDLKGLAKRPGGSLSAYGWQVEEFQQFQAWQMWKRLDESSHNQAARK